MRTCGGPGTSVVVPLQLDNTGAEIMGFTVTVHYGELLTYVTSSLGGLLPAGWTVAPTDYPADDYVSLTAYTGQDPLSGGTGVAADMRFNVSSGALGGQTIPLVPDGDSRIDGLAYYYVPGSLLMYHTRIWDGGNGVAGNNWTTAANWVDDVAPIAGDRLVFSGATQRSTNNDFGPGTMFDSIVFVNGGFTLSGSSVKLNPVSGGAVDNVLGQNRINLPITSDSTGTAIVQAGTLQLGPNAQGLVLNLGGVDIRAGALQLTYATPGDDPATVVDTRMKASYNGGAWTGGKFQSTTAPARWLDLGLEGRRSGRCYREDRGAW